MKYKVSVQQVDEGTDIIDCYPFEIFPKQCKEDSSDIIANTVSLAEDKFGVCLDTGGDDNTPGLTIEEISFYEDLPTGTTVFDVVNFIRDTLISKGLPCGLIEPMYQIK